MNAPAPGGAYRPPGGTVPDARYQSPPSQSPPSQSPPSQPPPNQPPPNQPPPNQPPPNQPPPNQPPPNQPPPYPAATHQAATHPAATDQAATYQATSHQPPRQQVPQQQASPHPGAPQHQQAPQYQAPPIHDGAGGYDVSAVSVGDLIGNVTRDLSTLMRQELALAQAELKQEATTTGKAAGALGAAGFAGYFVLLFLSLALWGGLANLMEPGWAALVVAVLWAVVAAVLFTTGRTKLRRVHPKPERTVDTLSNVPEALKGQRGGTR